MTNGAGEYSATVRLGCGLRRLLLASGSFLDAVGDLSGLYLAAGDLANPGEQAAYFSFSKIPM